MSQPDRLDDRLDDGPGPSDELVPSVEIPDLESADGDIDGSVQGLFWRLVLVFNVALFGLAVGPMFMYFQGNLRIGGGLFVLGVFNGVYGVVRYRRFKRRRLEDD